MAKVQTQDTTQADSLGPGPDGMTAKAARSILAAWQDASAAYKEMTGQPLTFGPLELAAAEYLGY